MLKFVMKENLLQFIWKFKLFSSPTLKGVNNEIIDVLNAGTENLNSGPDFKNAKIYIDNQLWAGNIEIHIKSSDWYLHQHQKDERYDAVILHVVWEHDVEVFRKTNEPVVTIELKNHISSNVLSNYQQLFSKNLNWINCEKNIDSVNDFKVNNWLESLYFERLVGKSDEILQLLKKANNNWEAVLFVLLAKNFGLKTNAEAFLNTANSFDFSIVRKVSGNQELLEALFMGQAGLLEGNAEVAYFQQLKKDYDYLRIKYKLHPISKDQVQFFRLRPNNFPTIRWSQLAALYHKNQHLFSIMLATQHKIQFYELFKVTTSFFWENHYTFEKESKKSIKKVTKNFIDLLLINTIIPVKFVYFKSMGKDDLTQLIELIEEIKPEKNNIIANFNSLKINSENALKTQALLQLKNEYCRKHRCLSCVIGKELLHA